MPYADTLIEGRIWCGRHDGWAEGVAIHGSKSVAIPPMREWLSMASSKRTGGAHAHGIYNLGIYKGLDLSLGK